MPVVVKPKEPVKIALSAPSKAPKDRSPSFPFIPLQASIERLEAFEKYFGRHPAPAAKAGLAWAMKEKSSQGDQTLAALRSFGLIKYEGMGPERQVRLSDEGRGYLRAQQDSVKKALLKQCALRPKIIRHFWALWGADRPPDPVALDALHDDKFSDAGAQNFLKVYDDTIAYAGLSDSDKLDPKNEGLDEQNDEENGGNNADSEPQKDLPGGQRKGKVVLMADERVVFTEESNPQQYVKLVASGDVDGTLLEALEDFVKRQRKRLGIEQGEPANVYSRRPSRGVGAAAAANIDDDEVAN